jgi:hypothetical protein
MDMVVVVCVVVLFKLGRYNTEKKKKKLERRKENLGMSVHLEIYTKYTRTTLAVEQQKDFPCSLYGKLSSSNFLVLRRLCRNLERHQRPETVFRCVRFLVVFSVMFRSIEQ